MSTLKSDYRKLCEHIHAGVVDDVAEFLKRHYPTASVTKKVNTSGTPMIVLDLGPTFNITITRARQ